MKKRILSLLLLVVLLVTSIPVMAISATDGEAENTTEYYKWYVGAESEEGYGPAPNDKNTKLVGNYTAFKNESKEDVYTDTKGSGSDVWYNKVGGANTILRYNSSSTQWHMGENGGLTAGFTYDSFKNAGSSSSSRPGESPVRMHIGGAASSWVSGNANAFVETTAVLTGVDGYTDNYWTTSAAQETFRFGALRGLLFGGTQTKGAYSLGIVWRAQDSGAQDPAGASLNFRDACGVTGTSKENFAPGGLTMYMKKETVEGGITYSIGYNTALHKYSASNSDTGVSYAASTGEVLDTTEHAALLAARPSQAGGDKSQLALFARAPMDVYTVRVYTGGFLTEAERAYNHLIDLLGFYQVPIPDGATAGMLMSIAPQFHDTIFVYQNDEGKGAADYDDVKASLEAALGYGPTEYYKWYVGADIGPAPTDENVTLVGNFTAFANEEGASYTTSKWSNKVTNGASGNLSLYSTKTWGPATNEKANGGGLNAGLVTRDDYNNAANFKAVRMEGGTSWADAENVLIETSFVYVGATGNDLAISTKTDVETFRFGSLRGHIFPLFNTAASMRLVEVWRANDSAVTNYYGQNTSVRDICGGVDNFSPAGLTLYMQKTTAADEGTDYITYSVRYNNGLKNAGDCPATGVAYTGYVRDDLTTQRISKADDAALWNTINAASKRDYKCTFYQRSQHDVYTLRAYTGGVLTQEEKEYNHLIDLLGFYQVEIPLGITPDSLMPIASDYMDTPFVYGTTFDDIQDSLEAEVSNVATIVCGSETQYYCIPEGGLVLADVLKDKTVFGYRLGEENHAPTVALTAADTVTVFGVDAVQISSTVDVAVLGKADSDKLAQDTVFLRFNALVNKEQFRALEEVENFRVVKMGILITPLSYVEQTAEYWGKTAAEAFTKMPLQTWYEAKSTVQGRTYNGAYLDVAADEFRFGFEDEYTHLTLSGGFGHFSEATLTHNPYFAAVAYFEVDIDGNNKADHVTYGVFEEERCVKVTDIVDGAMRQIDDSTQMYTVLQTLRNEFYRRELASQE